VARIVARRIGQRTLTVTVPLAFTAASTAEIARLLRAV
jgi:hypothetical protein